VAAPAAEAESPRLDQITRVHQEIEDGIRAKTLTRTRLSTGTGIEEGTREQTTNYTIYSGRGSVRKVVITIRGRIENITNEFLFDEREHLVFAFVRKNDFFECGRDNIEVFNSERLYFWEGRLIRRLTRRKVRSSPTYGPSASTPADCPDKFPPERDREDQFSKEDRKLADKAEVAAQGYLAAARKAAGAQKNRLLRRLGRVPAL
jgi:hypothetical protein